MFLRESRYVIYWYKSVRVENNWLFILSVNGKNKNVKGNCIYIFMHSAYRGRIVWERSARYLVWPNAIQLDQFVVESHWVEKSLM